MYTVHTRAISTAPDNQRKSFNEMCSNPHNSRTPVEQFSESCVLDFFGNDGLEDGYIEGSPVHEAHVAFSVEGLGKVGMETPVHSPKQPGRTFSHDFSSSLLGAKKVSSFKNLKHLDDIEIGMNELFALSMVLLYWFLIWCSSPMSLSSESPENLRHQVLENDLDFMISNGQRQHTRGRNFDFQGVVSRPDWSFFATENDRDNTSLLSEESCSSSAVRVNETDDLLPRSTRKHSKRRHVNSYAEPDYKYHVDITSTERTQDRSRDFFQQENISHGSGKCRNISKSSKFKPFHHSNTSFQEKQKSTPDHNWWSEERYMSVDINSGSSSFHQNSYPPAGSKHLSRDPFIAFDSPDLDATPSQHCEPVASSPSGSFISQKFAFHDSPPVTSNIGFGPRKSDPLTCSHDQIPSPDLSAQESFSKAEEGKSKFQPKKKSRQEEENAILKNLFTVSEDAASALQSKDKNIICSNARDEVSGLEESIKATYMPDHAGEASSFPKSPDKIQNAVDEKVESHDSEIPLPCQSQNKEMEDSEPQELRGKVNDKVNSLTCPPRL